MRVGIKTAIQTIFYSTNSCQKTESVSLPHWLPHHQKQSFMKSLGKGTIIKQTNIFPN